MLQAMKRSLSIHASQVSRNKNCNSLDNNLYNSQIIIYAIYFFFMN